MVNCGRTDGARRAASAPSVPVSPPSPPSCHSYRTSARESATPFLVLSRDSVGLCPSLPARAPRRSMPSRRHSPIYHWPLATHKCAAKPCINPPLCRAASASSGRPRLLPELWQHRPVDYCSRPGEKRACRAETWSPLPSRPPSPSTCLPRSAFDLIYLKSLLMFDAGGTRAIRPQGRRNGNPSQRLHLDARVARS